MKVGSDNDGNNVGNSTASEDQNVELSEVERGGDYATNDVEPAPNLLDNEGNPVKNYPLPSHPNDRRAEFENALMRGYMTKRASEGLGEEPERVYQSEVAYAIAEKQSVDLKPSHRSSIKNSICGAIATGSGGKILAYGQRKRHREHCGPSTKFTAVSAPVSNQSEINLSVVP